MNEFLNSFFSSSYMPHGHCFLWTPSILWINVISDILIAASYYSIPVALLYFVRKRRDLRFSWILLMFAAFILACGTTHVLGMVTVWYPIYGVEGVAKAATAGISFLTACALWPLIPKALALPSPSALEDEVRDRRAIEERLRLLNEALEERVRVRTQELTAVNSALRKEIEWREDIQQELNKRADQLVATNAELQQFAYFASHDLREPLRMITSFTQLIQKRYGSLFDAGAKEMFDFIVKGASRMDALTSSLLVFSRVTSRPLPFVSTPAEDALNAALQNLHAQIAESGAKIESGGLPAIHGTPTQITQLFQNLISNSIKFRASEPPRITVTARDLGSMCEFCVRDNGIGIAERYLEKVFDVFRRLHTADEYPGTGIGLAVCKKIVERHGGRIWVESKPGEGSAFFFTLPREHKAQTADTSPPSEAAAR